MADEREFKSHQTTRTLTSDDICIVAYPRSGITWLQMILYQLLTDGDMNVSHISQVVPFLERPLLHGPSVNGPLHRRAFKTHLRLGKVRQRSGKYIYLARNGKDVLVSYFHFHKHYLDYSRSFADFVNEFLAGSVRYGSWFQHVVDARRCRADKSILFLKYEDMVDDLEGQLHRITSFLRLSIPESKRLRVLDRCSFAFMRQYESKFDYAAELLWESTSHLHPGSFLRRGKLDGGKECLTPQQELALDSAASRVLQTAPPGALDTPKGITRMPGALPHSSILMPRPDDIYIVTYPRSGTTWLQMILYQLLTNGDMNFVHICQFAPFLERTPHAGDKLAGLRSPRVFKTHYLLSSVKQWPGKYIYCTRDAKDVVASYYHFDQGFQGSLDAYVQGFLAGTVSIYGSWFNHITDARLYLRDESVLFLTYEELVRNFDASLQGIISFLGLNISEAKRAEVGHRCSFAFMRQHESKFAYEIELAVEKLERHFEGRFLRHGKTDGSNGQFTPGQEAAFESTASRFFQNLR